MVERSKAAVEQLREYNNSDGRGDVRALLSNVRAALMGTTDAGAKLDALMPEMQAACKKNLDYYLDLLRLSSEDRPIGITLQDLMIRLDVGMRGATTYGVPGMEQVQAQIKDLAKKAWQLDVDYMVERLEGCLRGEGDPIYWSQQVWGGESILSPARYYGVDTATLESLIRQVSVKKDEDDRRRYSRQ